MTNERKIAEALLKSIQTAIKASVKLMGSESEDIKVFAIDVFTKLAEMEMILLEALSGESQKEQRNPLARRVRIP